MRKNPNQVGLLLRTQIEENRRQRCVVGCCNNPRHVRSVYCRRHFDHFTRNHSPTHRKPSKAALADLRRVAVGILTDCDLGKLGDTALARNLNLMRGWLYSLLRAGRVSPNPREIRRGEYEKKLTHYLGLLFRDGVSQDDLLVSIGALYCYYLQDSSRFDDSERNRQLRRCLGETLVKTSPRQFKVRVNSSPGSLNHQLQLSEALGVFEYVGNMLIQRLGFGLLQFGRAIGEREAPNQEWRNSALTKLASVPVGFVRSGDA